MLKSLFLCIVSCFPRACSADVDYIPTNPPPGMISTYRYLPESISHPFDVLVNSDFQNLPVLDTAHDSLALKHHRLGEEALLAGNVSLTLWEWRVARRLHPSDETANLDLADLLAQQHRFAESLFFYRRALYPKLALFRFNKINASYEWQSLLRYAKVCDEMGEWKEAAECRACFYSLPPVPIDFTANCLTEAFYDLATIYETLENYASLTHDYRRATRFYQAAINVVRNLPSRPYRIIRVYTYQVVAMR